MAIKIDLLPAHVALRKRLRGAVVLSVLALAGTAGALALVYDAKQKELLTAQENRRNFEAIAARTTAAETARKNSETQAQAVNDTVAWMLAVSKTGAERAALLNQIRQYVDENTVLTGIDVSDGQNLKINAAVTSPTQYAQFLINLRRAADTNGGPLFAGLPRAGGVKGFPEGVYPEGVPIPTDQPIVIPYPLNIAAEGKLKYPVVLPPDPTGGATATGAAGTPGTPGTPATPATP